MKVLEFKVLEAAVTGYLQEDHNRLQAHKVRPALVICAGGAYRWLSPREQDPIALRFAALGYQTFLLYYTTEEQASQYRPLRQLAETVRLLRQNARQWHLDPEKIAVLGFSAGGHLAGSLGVLWNHPALSLGKPCRPDALVLCYPVVTTGPFAHEESVRYVTDGDAEAMELLSLEKQVGPHMPPTFLWHCVGDESVPVENSILLLEAMQRHRVPYECHLFAGGAHGVSVCNQEVERPEPEAAAWVPLSQRWLNKLFQFIP